MLGLDVEVLFMARVKLNQFDPADGTSLSPFDFNYSIDSSISGISRMAGYVAFLAACIALLVSLIWVFS